jgi:hypothetical protein
MRPPERSSQPRAHRHRRLPLWHPPDGCARGAPSRVQAAIGQNSTKTAFRTSFFIWGGDSSAGRSRGAAERRRGSPPGPSAPSGRRRRARGRPTQIPGVGRGLINAYTRTVRRSTVGLRDALSMVPVPPREVSSRRSHVFAPPRFIRERMTRKAAFLWR